MDPSKFTVIDGRKIGIISLLLNLFIVHLFPAVAQDGQNNRLSVSNQFLNISSHSGYQTASYSLERDFLPIYVDKTPLNPRNLLNPAFQSNGESEVNWTTFSVITGGVLASYTGLFLHIKDRWWDGPRVSFHFSEEFYADGFDKFGHFYASKTQALAISRLYQSSGLSHNKSILLGAGVTLSVQTMIELMDGRTNAGLRQV
ncbi:MAG: DUF2279 domain-containing protein [Balneolaceae bacterium]|nr:DUF2279 domain-containing protein [Balneolaceae bacterium]